MAGRGKTPKAPSERRRANVPLRGEWQSSPGVGWQFGPIPAPPAGIGAASREVWTVWMRAWFASHWTPDDLPGLVVVIRLYDQCQRAFEDPFIETEGPGGRLVFIERRNPTSELRQMLDNYGISPKGQMDRRWAPPAKADPEIDRAFVPEGSAYGHLRAVGGAG